MEGTQTLVQCWGLRTRIFGAVSETTSVVLSMAQARRKAVTVRQQVVSKQRRKWSTPAFFHLPAWRDTIYPFFLLYSLKCGTIVMDCYVIFCTMYHFDSNNIWVECKLLDREAKCSFFTTNKKKKRNGPDNAGGNFFCYEAICFPQIETFLFLHKEYMKLLKGSLWNIMY